MRCEVCDRKGDVVRWLGHWMHEKCMPSHWRKDRQEYLQWK